MLDIAVNPKKLPLHEIEAAQLTRGLADLDAVVINANYAVPAGLIPGKDSIAIESTLNNPHNNSEAISDREGVRWMWSRSHVRATSLHGIACLQRAFCMTVSSA